MDEYLTQMKAREHSHLAVSLSGGVDSMVVAYLMHKLSEKHGGFKIVAVHLDYGNRPESGAECDYVRRWCERFGIIFHVRKIDEVKRATTRRDDYERVSREIRYTTYAEVMEKYDIPGMCFGHHRGDVQENVISNMMKGLSLLNLNGMAASSIVNGVRIWRPLLDFDKDVIFEYAHRYGIPYFKDTTPKWSTRGKLRNHLVPLLRDMYGDGFLNNLSGAWRRVDAVRGARGLSSAGAHHEVGRTERGGRVGGLRSTHGPALLRVEGGVPTGVSLRHGQQHGAREAAARADPEAGASGGRAHGQGQAQEQGRRGGLIIFRDRFFPRKAYAAAEFPIVTGESYVFGPWQVQTELLDGDHATVQNLRGRNPLTVWDLVHANGLSYVFPNAPQLLIDCDSRFHVLRAIEKVITDAMPIVSSSGAFDVVTPGDVTSKWLTAAPRPSRPPLLSLPAAMSELTPEASRLYRVRKTTVKMLHNRGYIVSENELVMTPEAFQTQFGDNPTREMMTILVEKIDDPSDNLFVFFPEDTKVGVKPIRNYCNRMKDENVTKAILVVQEGITPFARQALNEMAPRYKIEHFKETELLVDITEHTLVPVHRVLGRDEKAALLKRYRIRDSQLPRMQVTDPIARYYGMTRGQVVKIIRPSETAGRYVTYRAVI
ncbi:hypothetical protein ON010_g14562 [Phytophthora cinnamomi]|nr:hypothetical protein ON010_g14562 [Phytophthora cinnamomi]